MQSIRRVLIDHIDTLRAFVAETLRVDSGIYNVDQRSDITRQPDTIVQMETKWISGLLEAFQIIEQYNLSVARWVDHAYGLAQNLGATADEITQVERGKISAVKVIQSKSFDLDYLHWVLADISQEVDRLVATSQHLLSEVPRLIELADQFQGTYMEQVKQIAVDWTSGSRRDFFAPIIIFLQRMHATTDPQELLQYFGRYLDVLATMVTSTSMFIAESGTTTYSPEDLRSSHSIVEQLIKGIENLREFVQLRTQAYLLLLKHYEALLRAVLPPTISVPEWIVTYPADQHKSADAILPADLATDTLTLALQQAEEALIEWDAVIEKAWPFLKRALILNEHLQSPKVAKFLGADQRRLELYHKCRPRIAKTFSKLQTAAKKLS